MILLWARRALQSELGRSVELIVPDLPEIVLRLTVPQKSHK